LNSEKRIDNNRVRSLRYRRNRRIIMMRSMALAAGLLVVVLLIVVAVLQFKRNQITDYYDEETRYLTVLNSEIEKDSISPFAEDLIVVDPGNDDFSEAYDAHAGLEVDITEKTTQFSRNAYEQMNPASTTKIMTAYLALKYGELTDQVTVPEEALDLEEGASVAGLKPGFTLSLEQLLYGLMLPSGNDCANAIAIHMGGSIDGFVEMMNSEAAKLGAVDTHFTNASGMTDEAHYTTAYDLYLIMNAALKYDKFRKISTTKMFIAEFLDADGKAISRTWKNTNKYVSGDRELPYGLEIKGGKTGTTMAAGNCLVLATKDDREDVHISVVLKSENKNKLYDNMDYLLNKIN